MIPLAVLVVDDDPDIRTIARLSLELDPAIGVRLAGCHAEAMAELGGADAIDVILLDVTMPDIDGVALAGEIRALPRHARTPILFMTARAQPADIDRCLAISDAAVIIKPFDPLRFAADVRAMLAGDGSGAARLSDPKP